MTDGEPWGLKSSFYLQNCHRMKSDKFTKLLLQAAPAAARDLTCSSCSPGGWVCFATLPVQPWLFLLQCTLRGNMVWETRQRSSSPPAEGLMLACPSRVLLAGCCGSALGLNWFNKVKCPVRSEKRDRLLPGVGLGDLMGYLLSISQL